MGSVVNTITDGIGLTNHSGNAAMNALRQGSAGATGALTDAYKNQQTYLNPYNQAGNTALTQLTAGNLVNGNNLANDAGYQFRLNEGMKAVNAANVAGGNAMSGAAQKELARYSQDYASNEFNNAYNREFTRLSGLTGLGMNAANSLASASGDLGSNMANIQSGIGNAEAAKINQRAQQTGQLVQAGIGALFSDERLKTNIESFKKEDLDEMKKHLKAYAFNYINDEYGTGDWVGVMAQDLEKSKLGRTLVFENEKGEKQIDLKKVLSMFLATIAEG